MTDQRLVDGGCAPLYHPGGNMPSRFGVAKELISAIKSASSTLMSCRSPEFGNGIIKGLPTRKLSPMCPPSRKICTPAYGLGAVIVMAQAGLLPQNRRYPT